MCQKKLEAHALYFVLVISVIIALICSSLMLAAYYHNVIASREIQEKRVISNVESGISYVLSQEKQVNETVDLFENGEDSVRLKSASWGIFEVGSVEAKKGKNRFRKSFLYGFSPEDTLIALYLVDVNRPLLLCGNTYLKGDCMLPLAGIKRGYIQNKAYSNVQLVDGKILNSTHQMPKINDQIITQLNDLLRLNPLNYSVIKDTFSLPLIHSFADSTLFLMTSTIQSRFLKGNIIVYSNQKVIISKENELQDVLVIAPSIHIQEGFIGNAQFLATDSIYVEKNCHLKYPSVLGVIKQKENVEHAYITIATDSKVEGIVFAYQDFYDIYQSLIQIQENAQVHGQVYAHGFLEHKGKVYGNVICQKFRLQTNTSLYENYLLDAEIDISKRSPYFVGSALFASKKGKKIVKWLD